MGTRGDSMSRLFSTAIFGAVLKLNDPASSIRFGPTGDAAVLTATCEALTASVSVIAPLEASGMPSGNLSIYLANVAPTCAGVLPTTPCASHANWYPALFNCSLTGRAGRVDSGPLSAQRVEDRLANGELIGIDVRLQCPWPSLEEIIRVTYHSGSFDTAAGPHPIEVSVQHLGVPIPFRGLPNGNVVQLHDLSTPPAAPPSVPPATPPPPPSPSAPPLPPAPPPTPPVIHTSCKDILAHDSSAASGTYTIEVLGSELEVYCNMDMSDGGWTLAVEISGSNTNHINSAAVGSMPLSESGNRGAKLSDAMINAIKTEAFVFMCGGCAAFIEPIQFRADSNAACGAGDPSDTHRCEPCGGSSCQDYSLSCTGGSCSFSDPGGYCGTGGSYDRGMSTWPSSCGCVTQYNADNANGCYNNAYGHSGYLYVR